MASAMTEILIEGGAVSIADVERVARSRVRVALGAQAQEKLAASRSALEQAIAAGEVIYGVNTGFGSLARQRLDGDKLREVQRNLILSHAAGVGEPLREELVRGML